MKTPLPAHYQVGRLAVLLDMSVRWVKDRVKDGSLVGYRLGKNIVVDAGSVEQFLAARRIGEPLAPSQEAL